MQIKIVGFMFLVLAFSSVRAQNLSEIEKKFGTPVKSYSVSENIWMSPEFTDDGQLCMARLYPKKIDATMNYLDSILSLEEVKQVFDNLAPVSVRGQKKEDFSGLTSSGYIFSSGVFYKNVRIDFVSSAFYLDKKQPEKVGELPKVTAAQIVTITWLNQKCVNPSVRYNKSMDARRGSSLHKI